MNRNIAFLCFGIFMLVLIMSGFYYFSPNRIEMKLCSENGFAIVNFDGGANECYDIWGLKFYKVECDEGCYLVEDERAMSNAPGVIKLASDAKGRVDA